MRKGAPFPWRSIPRAMSTGRSTRAISSRAIRGKCIDLDGFHDGEVRDNVCVDVAGYGMVMNNTNPDMQSTHVRIEGNRLENVEYGGIFVIGTDNVIARNRLLNREYRALRVSLHAGRAGHVS